MDLLLKQTFLDRYSWTHVYLNPHCILSALLFAFVHHYTNILNDIPETGEPFRRWTFSYTNFVQGEWGDIHLPQDTMQLASFSWVELTLWIDCSFRLQPLLAISPPARTFPGTQEPFWELRNITWKKVPGTFPILAHELHWKSRQWTFILHSSFFFWISEEISHFWTFCWNWKLCAHT